MVEMATAIGYKKGGYVGALITSVAITLPIMIVFTLFMGALNRFIPAEVLNAITAPVLGTVSALMLTLTKKFFVQSAKQISVPLIILISIVSLVLIYFLGIHPSLIIVAMLLIVTLTSLKGGKE
jgi:chromate transporter